MPVGLVTRVGIRELYSKTTAYSNSQRASVQSILYSIARTCIGGRVRGAPLRERAAGVRCGQTALLRHVPADRSAQTRQLRELLGLDAFRLPCDRTSTVRVQYTGRNQSIYS